MTVLGFTIEGINFIKRYYFVNILFHQH